MNPPDAAKRLVVTVIVVTVAGPLVGGLIVAAIPLVPYFVGLAAAVHRSPEPLLASVWPLMTKVVSVFGFIVYESYRFGGLSAAISGVVSAGVIGRYGTVSGPNVIAIAITSIPLSVLIRWMFSRDTGDMLIATMMYTAMVQFAPAAMAAIACRLLLIRGRIIDAPSDQKPTLHHHNPVTPNSAR